jgi:1-deoxy-D-xylulose-5-phosphate synthase
MGIVKPILHLGLPDRFIDHGDPAKLLEKVGLNAAGVEQSIRNRFATELAAPVSGRKAARAA